MQADILEFLTTDSRPEVAQINKRCGHLIELVNDLRDELTYKTALLDALRRTSGKDWDTLLDRALTVMAQNFQ